LRWSAALPEPARAAAPGSGGGAVPAAEGAQAAQELHALLRADDPRARAHVLRHEAALRRLLGAADAAVLAAHIEQFDYETALHILTGWLARHPQAGPPPGPGGDHGGDHAAREPS